MYEHELSDRDRIANAFKELRRKGYLARMNFMCCSTCGSFELTEQAEAKFFDGKRVVSMVFWNRQSDRSFGSAGQLTETLWLQHGLLCDTPTGMYESSPESSAAIVETLRRHGLDASWDSDDLHAIAVNHKTEVAS